MESIGFRHRGSPSGDRFLGAFSFSPTPGPGAGAGAGGDELNEAEVCFSGDFPEPRARHRPALSSADSAFWGGSGGNHRHLLSRQLQGDGILAALSGGGAVAPPNVLIPSISSSSPSKPIPPSVPRRHPAAAAAQEREYAQSVPCRKLQQSSAPMNVPVPLAALSKQGKNRFFEVDNDFEDDEMLPPHEIVARGSGTSPRRTFSVLEGAGRTLKGRDLRQVRNAIWRQTGFLD